MTLGAQLAVTAATVAVTVIVTAVVNYFIAAPKKWKQQKEQEHNDIVSVISGLEKQIEANLQLQNDYQKAIRQDVGLLKSGVQAIIKNDLKLHYESWLKKGYAPIDVKEDLERMYDVYHNLGANGVLTGLHDQFIALPTERTVGRSRRKDEEINE